MKGTAGPGKIPSTPGSFSSQTCFPQPELLTTVGLGGGLGEKESTVGASPGMGS